MKDFIKKKWGWILGTGAFLAIGLTTLLIGFNMTGWSIIDWLQSPYAVTFFIIIGIGLITVLLVVVGLKRAKLGGYN